MLLGSVGTAGELILLEHTETPWQWLPVVALILGTLVCAGVLVTDRAWVAEVFRMVMIVFVFMGTVGTYLHYKGNVEFELEMYPDRGGLELFLESLKGATPALAPGAMLLLGLVGLVTIARPAKGPHGNHQGSG